MKLSSIFEGVSFDVDSNSLTFDFERDGARDVLRFFDKPIYKLGDRSIYGLRQVLFLSVLVHSPHKGDNQLPGFY